MLLDTVKNGISQILSIRKTLLIIYGGVALLFAGVVGLTVLIPHLTIPDLLRDVATLGELPFYAGFVSQLGLLFWSAATTLCFFEYFTLKKLGCTRKETLNFLLFAGLLSGYLMLDDSFMLHEEFFPDFLKIIPEKAVILMLGIAMLAFLYFNRQELLQNEFGLMFLAFMFFGISVVIDAVPTELYEDIYIVEKVEHILEDGAKFTAIITWVIFYARYGYQQLTKLMREKTAM
jgi:hypothetical protein